jgi:hypothetical protein
MGISRGKPWRKRNVVYSRAVPGRGLTMLRISKADQEEIREKIREGRIEGAAPSRENFVDTIIKKMKALGVIEDL